MRDSGTAKDITYRDISDIKETRIILETGSADFIEAIPQVLNERDSEQTKKAVSILQGKEVMIG